MIDINSEQVGPFTEAAGWVPRCRGGKKVAVSTFWRWARYGIAGVRLETIYCGTVRCTSREALQRFFERVSEARAGGADPDDPRPPARPRTDSRRRKASETARQQLGEMIAHPPGRSRKPVAGARSR
jgi:hypothetical protein